MGLQGLMFEGGGLTSAFKPEITMYTGKEEGFERFRQSFVKLCEALTIGLNFY